MLLSLNKCDICWSYGLKVALILISLVAMPRQTSAGTRKSEQESASRNTEGALVLHQTLCDGLSSQQPDLANPLAYFWHVFAQLPHEVKVYPSENYYYFQESIAGRNIWGNIRLGANKRELGIVSFAYSEFSEFPADGWTPFRHGLHLSGTNGVQVTKEDELTWIVSGHGRSVKFHLNPLPQNPPKLFALASNEVVIERTFDESGLQFFLLFNTEQNHFFWVLNEEAPVPEYFEALEQDVLAGHRTGFVFWIDRHQPARKVLAAVRRQSVQRNDYYDGPFDQLADNYAEQTRISAWMERAMPELKGRIDKYGYLKDQDGSIRVSLDVYTTYDTQAEALELIKQVRNSPHPHAFIAQGKELSLRKAPPGGETPWNHPHR